MKKWNIGIVGAGLIADFHAKAILELPNANLLAVCDIQIDRAKKLADQYNAHAFDSYEKMLQTPNLDIITIATPTGLHMEPTVAAAKAGINTICEKPLDITLDRIDAMIHAHKKAGTQLGGIFPTRFADSIEPLRLAIQQNRFGKITYAGAYVPWYRTHEYYQGSWRGTWKLDGGGALMNQSIHAIDMLCAFMPPVESVQAYTATLTHDIETEDTAAAALKFQSGALGIVYGTTASYPGQFKRFELSGSKGTVIFTENTITTWQFEDETPQDETIRKTYGKVSGAGGVSDPAAISHENHRRNFQAFLNALEANQPFQIDGHEARKAVALILAIYKSAKENRPVKLAEL